MIVIIFRDCTKYCQLTIYNNIKTKLGQTALLCFNILFQLLVQVEQVNLEHVHNVHNALKMKANGDVSSHIWTVSSVLQDTSYSSVPLKASPGICPDFTIVSRRHGTRLQVSGWNISNGSMMLVKIRVRMVVIGPTAAELLRLPPWQISPSSPCRR